MEIEHIITKLLAQAKEDSVEKLLVGSVIQNNNNEILIVRRAAYEDFLPNKLELPSGHIDEGETVVEALIRETKEETNLDIEKIERYIDNFDYRSKNGKLCRQFNFLVKVNNLKELKLNPEEHSEYIWVSKGGWKEFELDDYLVGLLNSLSK